MRVVEERWSQLAALQKLSTRSECFFSCCATMWTRVYAFCASSLYFNNLYWYPETERMPCVLHCLLFYFISAFFLLPFLRFLCSAVFSSSLFEPMYANLSHSEFAAVCKRERRCKCVDLEQDNGNMRNSQCKSESNLPLVSIFTSSRALNLNPTRVQSMIQSDPMTQSQQRRTIAPMLIDKAARRRGRDAASVGAAFPAAFDVVVVALAAEVALVAVVDLAAVVMEAGVGVAVGTTRVAVS